MIDTLNILPCHSIWKPSVMPESKYFGLQREEWVLVPFQIEGNDHLAMLEQILKCLIASNESTFTVFTGGYTKEEFPNISEGKSYYQLMIKYYKLLADRVDLLKIKTEIYKTKFATLISTFDDFSVLQQSDIHMENFHIEEYAMDSFDNLYFSLALCKLKHDIHNLKRVVIFGFEFKERRFRDLHWKYCGAAKALPDCIIDFNSNNPLHYDNEKHIAYLQSVNESETKYGYEMFVEDPFALRSKLFEKKNLRNFKSLSPKKSEFGKYLITFDPISSDEQLLDLIEQSELYR